MKSESQFNIVVSFKCALAGLSYAMRTQRNFRIHLAAAILVSLMAYWLKLPLTAWTLLILMIGLVLVVELLNTAIEVMVDLVSPEYHPLAKNAKDLAAGAVLLVAIVSVIVGILILGPPLWMRIFS
jgi:undecaprenol kinase